MTVETNIYIFVGDFNVSKARLNKAAEALGGEMEEHLHVSSASKRVTAKQIQGAVLKLYEEKGFIRRPPRAGAKRPPRRGMIKI
jgi:hypothetical protein